MKTQTNYILFKGWYYKFVQIDGDCYWHLSSQLDEMGHKRVFSAHLYSLNDCYEKIEKDKSFPEYKERGITIHTGADGIKLVKEVFNKPLADAYIGIKKVKPFSSGSNIGWIFKRQPDGSYRGTHCSNGRTRSLTQYEIIQDLNNGYIKQYDINKLD